MLLDMEGVSVKESDQTIYLQTIGRLTRTGCNSMFSMIVSSVTDGFNNPNSSAGLFVVRNAVRGVKSAAANNPCNCDLVHPICKYSMIVGLYPAALMIFKTFRLVSQSGL